MKWGNLSNFMRNGVKFLTVQAVIGRRQDIRLGDFETRVH
jgi:hypothetical protein